MAVLTEQTINENLLNNDIIISPILDKGSQLKGGSINLRLGTKFITTKKTEYAELDPSKLSTKTIREFQARYSLTFGGTFMLHPQHLVLASTFEFLKLPQDVCAHVLTRSKYGRLGLIIATAAYVHPNWLGCLTLELFNYGDAPIALKCGSAIAQLILQKADKTESGITNTPRYIPTGPLFGETSSEQPDWKILESFERAYYSR